MSEPKDRTPLPPADVIEHYATGYEADRLATGEGRLECARIREILERFLPPPPARVLDVGGGPGGHARWLSRKGYTVHIVDVVPLHVRLARESAERDGAPLASAEVGDARSLSSGDGAVDAVLLFGPLYHLTDRAERLEALREAHRVLGPDGVLLAAGISRFASTFDGLRRGYLRDPDFAEIASRDRKDGQHRNPTGKPEYFMDTFFHHPEELREEIREAGFPGAAVLGVEGPGWLLADFDRWWDHEEHRARLLGLARDLESEPSLLGVSAHLIAVARKSGAR